MKYYRILIGLLLTGCSVLPPAFNDTRVEHISYSQVMEDVQRYENEYVRWGGVVVDVRKEQSGSLMQVLFYPLDHYGRPKVDQPAEGYFLLKSPGNSDQDIVYDDKEIVTIGVVEGKTKPLDKQGNTALPLIHATAIHPWPIAYRENYYQHCPSCYFKQLFW